MRLRGIRKNLYLITSARPDLNRKLLHLSHSLEEVRQLLNKGFQKNLKKQ